MQVLCRNFKIFIYLFINLNIRELLFSDFQITDGRQSHRFLFFRIKKGHNTLTDRKSDGRKGVKKRQALTAKSDKVAGLAVVGCQLAEGICRQVKTVNIGLLFLHVYSLSRQAECLEDNNISRRALF